MSLAVCLLIDLYLWRKKLWGCSKWTCTRWFPRVDSGSIVHIIILICEHHTCWLCSRNMSRNLECQLAWWNGIMKMMRDVWVVRLTQCVVPGLLILIIPFFHIALALLCKTCHLDWNWYSFFCHASAVLDLAVSGVSVCPSVHQLLVWSQN